MQQAFAKFLEFGCGQDRRGDGRQRRVAQPSQLHRFPARRRPALLRQPHADHGFGQAAARPRAGAVLHRVQLHAAAGLRLRGAGAPLRHATCRWAAPTSGATSSPASISAGACCRRRCRLEERPALRAHLPAADDRVGRQDGQDRGRRGVAQRGAAVALRLLAILAQHRGRRRRALPEALHDAAA